MSFKDWLFTNYPGGDHGKVVAWGLGHILTLATCIVIIIGIYFLFRNKSSKAKKTVVFVLVGLILLCELLRRSVNLIKTDDYSFHNILVILLPRPWCAISCWSLILAVIVNKKFLYNYASISAMLCAVIFFAYPGVGFRVPYLLFDDLYSIATHSLLLISSVSLITLKFTEFKYKHFGKMAIWYLVTLAYTFMEIFLLKIEADPMYFMPGGDIQKIFNIGYGVYLPVYIIFVALFFNTFYFIPYIKNKQKK